ncbi:MAG: glutamyl-tRNA reductase [Chitinophagaceae bacterium]
MNSHYPKEISNFYVAGINYNKTDASIRGQFAINDEQNLKLLQKASLHGLDEIFILSTCNRTEIYGFAQSSHQLIELLCSGTKGTIETFKKLAYIKRNSTAVEHLFQVAAGLDSQILGDYEIIGQVKSAIKLAKENSFVGAFTERLINSVLQSSKEIKNNTQLSSGTVSVSFAAVQYIRTTVINYSSKSILLLGVGKIGRNTCKNLVDYLNTKNITLINRTPEKARNLASEFNLQFAWIENLSEEIKKADIIITTTNSTEPVILKEHLKCGKKTLIIDLSVPCNVAEDAQTLPNVQFVNVDELSKLKDETLRKREAEVPKAKAIIAEAISEFNEWCKMRQHAPFFKAVKLKLKEIQAHPLFISTDSCNKTEDQNIQKTINLIASKVRQDNRSGCRYIEAINHFIKADAAH